MIRNPIRGNFGALVAYLWLGDQRIRFNASFKINTEMDAAHVGLIWVATKLRPFKPCFKASGCLW
jgi:hypothetical protein